MNAPDIYPHFAPDLPAWAVAVVLPAVALVAAALGVAHALGLLPKRSPVQRTWLRP